MKTQTQPKTNPSFLDITSMKLMTTKRFKNSTIIAVLALASIALTFSAHAQVLWLPTGAGNWDVATNWSGTYVPTSADLAAITNGGTAIVSDNPGDCGQINIGDNGGTGNCIVTTGGVLTFDTWLYVGCSENGSDPGEGLCTLIVTNGTVNKGAGDQYGSLVIGDANCQGQMIVTGTGTVNVSSWVIYVGLYNGTGRVYVEQNGRVNFTAGAFEDIGDGNSQSAVYLQDNGVWNGAGAALNVPDWGGATSYVSITNNAQLLCDALYIGKGGVGEVNLWGGTVKCTYMEIGTTGNGTWNQYGGTCSNASSVALTTIYSGSSATVNLNGGTFNTLQVTGGVSTSTFNFNGGTLQAGAGASANFMSGLTAANVLANGAVIDSAGNNITIAQPLLDGGGGLTKLGSGALTLTGTNTYSGTTLVSAGKLATTTATTGTGAYTVADGAELSLTVQSANTYISPAGMTLGAAGATTLDFDLGEFGNPTNAPFEVAGTLTGNGTVTVNVADANPQLGQIPLIKYGSKSGTGSFVLGQLPPGVTANLATNGNAIVLNITAISIDRWAGLAGGNWDINITTNWVDFNSGVPIKYVDGDSVLFDDSAPGSNTVNLVTIVSPRGITVANSNLSYSFSGIGKISGVGGLTKQGTNSLTVNITTNDYTGPTSLGGGTVFVTHLANGNSPSAIGASSADPANLVFDGGTLSYNGPAVTINRCYSVTPHGGTLDAEADLNLGGLVNGGETFHKAGPGTLTYSGTGTNKLTAASDSIYYIDSGTVVLNGSGGQTNIVLGWFWVGDTLNGPGNLILTNTTLNDSPGWVLVGTGNGRGGYTSTMTLNNSTLKAGGVDLGDSWGLSGYNGTPVLTLNNSTLYLPGSLQLRVGWDAGIATVNVNGTKSLVYNGGGYFLIGYNGSTGIWNQTDGTTITHGWFLIGYGGGTTVGTVNFSGGTFTQDSLDFQIGGSGSGTWNQSGGTVTAGNWFSVGRYGGGVGVLNISGGTFSTTDPTKTPGIGWDGTGTLNLSGTGIFNAAGAGTMILGADAIGVGTVNLEGGTLFAPAVAGGSGDSMFNFNGGVLKALGNTINFVSNLVLANVMTNGAIIDDGGYTIGIPQALTGDPAGDGGLTKLGNGTLALNGVNTYTNTTTVTAGTLAGTGTIAGPVVVNPGATLSPGNSIGTLTVNKSPVLNGTVKMEVDRNGGSPLSDELVVVGNPIAYHGTLVITNTGAPLQVGDTFTLFSASGYSGSFASVVSQTPGQFVTWSINTPGNGQVRVASVTSSTIPKLTNSVSGGNLTLTWPAANTGWTLQAQTNSLAVGLGNNWVNVTGSSLVNTESITINPANGAVFYRLVYNP